MRTGTHSNKRNNSSSFVPTMQTQLQSRPWAEPTEAIASSSEAPELQKEPEDRERFGHDLANIPIFAPAPPPESGDPLPIQAKFNDFITDSHPVAIASELEAPELQKEPENRERFGHDLANIPKLQSPPVIQCQNTIVDDPTDMTNKSNPGEGRGWLKESSGDINPTVTFGPLRNDCGTMMHAFLIPSVDDLSGSIPQHGSWPDWWDQAKPSNSSYWVRGHLLNHNLGGPGEKRNLTPITKKCNSQHHSLVEKALKLAAQNGSILEYTVTANYDSIGPTQLKGDNTDPQKSFWPNITTSLSCDFTITEDENTIKTYPTVTILNER